MKVKQKESDLKIRVTSDMRGMLEQIAADREVPISAVVREALAIYLREMPSEAIAQSAKTALESARKSQRVSDFNQIDSAHDMVDKATAAAASAAAVVTAPARKRAKRP